MRVANESVAISLVGVVDERHRRVGQFVLAGNLRSGEVVCVDKLHNVGLLLNGIPAAYARLVHVEAIHFLLTHLSRHYTI